MPRRRTPRDESATGHRLRVPTEIEKQLALPPVPHFELATLAIEAVGATHKELPVGGDRAACQDVVVRALKDSRGLRHVARVPHTQPQVL